MVHITLNTLDLLRMRMKFSDIVGSNPTGRTKHIKINKMTTLEICRRYLGNRTETSTTLAIMQDVLRERLSESGYRTIWLQSHISGRSTFLITLFQTSGDYIMRSYTMSNFRNFRTDGDIEEESVRINTMMDVIMRGCGLETPL